MVVATQFSETRQRESALMEAANLKRNKSSTSTFTMSDSQNKGCYGQILSLARYYIRREYRKLKRRIFGIEKKRKIVRKRKCKKHGTTVGKTDSSAIHFHHHHHHHIHHHHLHLCPNISDEEKPISAGQANNIPPPSIHIDEFTKGEILAPTTLPVNKSALIIPDTTVVICHSSSLTDSLISQNPLTTVALYSTLSKSQNSVNDMCPGGDNNNSSYRSAGDASLCEAEISQEVLHHCEKEACNSLSDSDDYSDDDYTEHKSTFKMLCSQSRKACESNHFKGFIMGSIFLNTLTMAMEHYNQVSCLIAF